jgi:hypothetical protein
MNLGPLVEVTTGLCAAALTSVGPAVGMRADDSADDHLGEDRREEVRPVPRIVRAGLRCRGGGPVLSIAALALYLKRPDDRIDRPLAFLAPLHTRNSRASGGHLSPWCTPRLIETARLG